MLALFIANSSPMPAVKQLPIPEEFLSSPIYLLLGIAGRLSAAGTQFYRRHFGLGTTEVMILHALLQEPNIPLTRITYVSQMDKSVASRSLASLEAKGYTEKMGSLANRRQHLFRLSSAGERLVASRLRTEGSAQGELLFTGFGVRERKVALTVLHRFLDNTSQVQAHRPLKKLQGAPGRKTGRSSSNR
jgi:DNA-binding MarR family transcriptional regulator